MKAARYTAKRKHASMSTESTAGWNKMHFSPRFKGCKKFYKQLSAVRWIKARGAGSAQLKVCRPFLKRLIMNWLAEGRRQGEDIFPLCQISFRHVSFFFFSNHWLLLSEYVADVKQHRPFQHICQNNQWRASVLDTRWHKVREWIKWGWTVKAPRLGVNVAVVALPCPQ